VGSVVYIAHPIDSIQDGYQQVMSSCYTARAKLSEHGVGSYLPGRAWDLQKDYSGTLPAEVNRAALLGADGLLVMADVSDRTIGVGYEIGLFEQTGKPIAAVTKTHRLAFGSNVTQFTDIQRAVDWLAVQAEAVAQARVFGQLVDQPHGKYVGDGPVPVRAYADDAGFDIFYSGTEPLLVPGYGNVDVPAGVSVELPEGMWCLLIGRSSSFRNRGLLVNTAVIDSGFRGELFAIARNLTRYSFYIVPGERIAQIVPMANMAGRMSEFRRAFTLTETTRGVKGFGSSGL
jgi:deoxyuridine 5'-triphosphate nucleotidohydrolase